MKLFITLGVLLIFSSSAQAQLMKRYAPDFYSLQYAGSIGYLSLGVGYNILKDKGRASIHYGYLPKLNGGNFHIATGKFHFSPIAVKTLKRYTIRPIDFGIFLTYHFGPKFNTTWSKNRYPDDYYWWINSWRLHLALEQSVSYTPKNSKIKNITFYSELNTNDLYLVSFVENTKSLNLADIIKVGVGTRLYF